MVELWLRHPLLVLYYASMREQSAQGRWELWTQRPLLALAVVFAVAYAVPIVDTSADHALTAACTGVEWVVWGRSRWTTGCGWR